jgi:hypothetical protein
VFEGSRPSDFISRIARCEAAYPSSVIVSGGEWISSTDIENVACLYPDVASAVCIAARHPKWDERPLLLIVKKPDSALTAADLLAFCNGQIATWWKPGAVVFVESLPLGATGKVLKHRLRTQYGVTTGWSDAPTPPQRSCTQATTHKRRGKPAPQNRRRQNEIEVEVEVEVEVERHCRAGAVCHRRPCPIVGHALWRT